MEVNVSGRVMLNRIWVRYCRIGLEVKFWIERRCNYSLDGNNNE